jgi:hypothetical protein
VIVEITPDFDATSPGEDVTPEDTRNEILSLQMGVIVEQMQILSIWTIKVTFLIGYGRLLLFPPLRLHFSTHRIKTNAMITAYPCRTLFIPRL